MGDVMAAFRAAHPSNNGGRLPAPPQGPSSLVGGNAAGAGGVGDGGGAFGLAAPAGGTLQSGGAPQVAAVPPEGVAGQAGGGVLPAGSMLRDGGSHPAAAMAPPQAAPPTALGPGTGSLRPPSVDSPVPVSPFIIAVFANHGPRRV